MTKKARSPSANLPEKDIEDTTKKIAITATTDKRI